MLFGMQCRSDPDLRRGPFGLLSGRSRRRATWCAAGSVATQLVPLLLIERRLRMTGGPGVIPFELAGSVEASEQIMRVWGPRGCQDARLALLLDFQFPAAYAALRALACAAAADAHMNRDRKRLARLGSAVAWLQLAAAGFDYVENVALLLVLGGRRAGLPRLARRSAIAKFAIIGVGYAYIGAAISPSPAPR
jgi:hypothetical protein